MHLNIREMKRKKKPTEQERIERETRGKGRQECVNEDREGAEGMRYRLEKRERLSS